MKDMKEMYIPSYVISKHNGHICFLSIYVFKHAIRIWYGYSGYCLNEFSGKDFLKIYEKMNNWLKQEGYL